MLNKKILSIVVLTFILFTFVQCQKQSANANKVVYHLADLDKVGFVLNNIKNHIKGVKDKKALDIILVVHGPALKAFHNDKVVEGVVSKVSALQDKGIKFNACGNTMNAQSVELN